MKRVVVLGLVAMWFLAQPSSGSGTIIRVSVRSQRTVGRDG